MPSKTEPVATGADTDAGTPADRSIGDAINIATRSVHTKLNKLIIMRLRLALPPQADDASNYVQGLLHITPIYETFESLWQAILDADPVDTPRKTTSNDKDSNDASQHPPTANSRIHLLLFHLRIEKMTRASALRQDLAALTGWADAMLAEQLGDIASESPLLAGFIKHIREAVTERPHVLLAYAWVLYMALFSGGRFIRASLERVEPTSAFWTPLATGSEVSEVEGGSNIATAMLGPWLANQVGLGGSSNKKPRNPQQQDEQTQTHPLAFFRFDTPTDGEDLKQTFKSRLAESTMESSASNLLSSQEREDIVKEAQFVFDSMVAAVGELDEVCGTEEEEDTAKRQALSLRSRDSVVVEKEKRRRLAARIAMTEAGREALRMSAERKAAGVEGEVEDGEGTKGKREGLVRFS